MLRKLRDNFKRWLQKDGKKKIYDISCIIGFVAGISIFFLFILYQVPDTKPYTKEELKELYIQKEMVSERDYTYEKLKDINYSINFDSDYYVSVYENEQLKISVYTDYDGNFLKQETYDKKLNKIFAFIMQAFISTFFGYIVMWISKIFLTIFFYVFYKVLYKYLFIKVIKSKQRKK